LHPVNSFEPHWFLRTAETACLLERNEQQSGRGGQQAKETIATEAEETVANPVVQKTSE
jgi:hypothetical protein